MAAIPDTGEQKHWFKGLPTQGGATLTLSNDTGTQKFWFKGQPVQYSQPAPVSGGGTPKSYGFIIG